MKSAFIPEHEVYGFLSAVGIRTPRYCLIEREADIATAPFAEGGPVVNQNSEVVGIVAATAAVESFYRATGSLPQNVNWDVKAEYAQLLFDQPPKLSIADTRRTAIDRTQNAICQVSASN